MLECCGQNIMNLEPQSWKQIIDTLGKQLLGKRQNMRAWSISIFEFIHSILGQDNFLALLSNLLSNDEKAFIISEIRSEMEKNPKGKREEAKKIMKSHKRDSLKRQSVGNYQKVRQDQTNEFYNPEKRIGTWDVTNFFNN